MNHREVGLLEKLDERRLLAAGAVVLNGTLTVTGNATVSGNSTTTGLLIANGGIDADVGNALFNTASFAGAVTVNDTLALSSATLTCPEGSKIQFHSASMFISSTANTNIRYDVGAGAEHGMWVGGTKMLAVDGVAVRASGALEANSFIDRETGMDLIAEIKQQKARIEALEKQLNLRR